MMTSSEFVSDKSEAEIQMIFTEFKDIAEDYVVVITPDGPSGNVCSFEPSDGEWEGRHYHDTKMAEFISQIIAPGEVTDLTFRGQEDEIWGFRIERDRVRNLGAEIKLYVSDMTENELEAEIKVFQDALRVVRERTTKTMSEMVDEVLSEEIL
jgi:hypothetical protein